MKRWLPLIVLAAFASLLIPIAIVGAEPPATVYFSQTGHHVGAPFLKHWRQHGGLPVFGYPLTEPMQEKSTLDGKTYTVQYFERARLEAHPENNEPWDVILGQLGRHASERIVGNKAFDPVLTAQAVDESNVYFAESKHTLQGDFLQYWRKNGDLALFGYPISEQFVEKSAYDGKPYTVQYFERYRLELHPDNQPPFNIELGQLGRQYIEQQRIVITPVPRQANAPDYNEALFATATPTATATATPRPKPTQPRPDLGRAYIEVNLTTLHLNVWENGVLIYDTPVSTGRPGWETPQGVFYIHTYVVVQDMEGGGKKGSPEYYFQPDVPWVMYFDNDGDAIHGVYWHNNFGVRATSHGCVGVPVAVAKWIWDWSSIGTPVWIHD